MLLAIVIVFEYSKTLKLPGALYDVLMITDLLEKINADRLVIITDISRSVLKDRITKEVELISYVNKQKLLKDLKVICSQHKQIIIYYSGHAKYDHIFLPNFISNGIFDHQLSNYVIETKKLNGILHHKSESILIFDCCGNISFDFPFILGRESGLIKQINGRNYHENKSILISSSSDEDNSFTTVEGSLFTKSFCEFILENKREFELSNLLREVDKSTKKLILKKGGKNNNKNNCHLTHPRIINLWSWFCVGNIITVKENYLIVERRKRRNFLTRD